MIVAFPNSAIRIPCLPAPVPTEDRAAAIGMANFFGGLMTLHNCEIVDCGASCEVIFFCICPKNLLGDFFDSLAIYPLFPHSLECFNLILIY